MEGQGDDGDWQRLEDEGFIALVGPFYQDVSATETGRYRFLAEDKHRNRIGIVQGGMLVTFADRTIGNFLRRGRAGRVQATAQLDVHFVGMAQIGSYVKIEVKITRETGKLVFATGVLTSEGRTVATVAGIWSILKQGEPEAPSG